MRDPGPRSRPIVERVTRGALLTVYAVHRGNRHDFARVLDDRRLTTEARSDLLAVIAHYAEHRDVPNPDHAKPLVRIQVAGYQTQLWEFRVKNRKSKGTWRLLWFFSPRGVETDTLLLANMFYKTDRMTPPEHIQRAESYLAAYLREKGKI